jgi:hypothetical protein
MRARLGDVKAAADGGRGGMWALAAIRVVDNGPQATAASSHVPGRGSAAAARIEGLVSITDYVLDCEFDGLRV